MSSSSSMILLTRKTALGLSCSVTESSLSGLLGVNGSLLHASSSEYVCHDILFSCRVRVILHAGSVGLKRVEYNLVVGDPFDLLLERQHGRGGQGLRQCTLDPLTESLAHEVLGARLVESCLASFHEQIAELPACARQPRALWLRSFERVGGAAKHSLSLKVSVLLWAHTSCLTSSCLMTTMPVVLTD